jgi:hypothetical protein
MLMFERFTDRARRSVVLAQEEARNMQHNYIGTEHVLLGLLGESDGVAARVLSSFGMTPEGTRQEITAIVGTGSAKPAGHIPFTPRAKKTLELSLREALQLSHNYIGTEHILLGLIREGDGVAAVVMKQHADLGAIRTATLDLLPSLRMEAPNIRRWLRGQPAPAVHPGEVRPRLEQSALTATPAGDKTLSDAARLAATLPVGSHHLLLAALADPDTAAARALSGIGVDLDQAMEALRTADVTGTSDELPEEAGRRQMVVRVTDERITLEATDPLIVEAGQSALRAVGDQADPPGTIRGDLPASAALSAVWQALLDGLGAIGRKASEPPAETAEQPENDPGTEAA